MKRPLRLCMVTTFYPPAHFGGDARFVENLSHALVEDGHHVEVVACLDSYRLLAPGNPVVPLPEEHPHLVVHRLESQFGRLAPLVTNQVGHPLLQRGRLRRILADGFDVIHYHNISLVGGPAVLRYGMGLKLYTTHEFWLVCPMHILHKFNERPCERRACLRCSLAFRRPPQWWRYAGLLSRAASAVDLFISPSQFCIDKHRELGFAAPFARLPNFVPRVEDRAEKPRPASARPYFLFAGRLEQLKGLQTLIPLFRDYSRADLWIAGRGGFEPELRRLAGTAGNVRFLGYCRGDALSELYRGAVAVLVPSLCQEVFPTVILEAFQHGTPVLARDLGGMREMVEDSGGGLLFEHDDAFVRARELLLDDPAHRDRLGLCGREACVRLYSKEAHLARYYELIEEHLARKRTRSRLEGATSGT
jgi:glycosyltransferase involved in cell wall biosynthesis